MADAANANPDAGHTPDPAWLTPGVRGIGGASLLSDLGHEIPTALLPSFLTVTLGAPASALGIIEGISDGLSGAAKFVGGPLGDDPHRRRATAVTGYAVTAVLSSAIGVATSAVQVGILRAGAWTARGIRGPARNALLAGRLGRLMIGISLFEVGNVAATLLILRATQQLTPAIGASSATMVALLLYAGYNSAAALSSVPAGQIADRLGRDGPRYVLLSGVLLFLVAYAAFAASLTNPWLLLAPFILAGIGIGCVETAEHASVAAEAPQELRGSAFGLLATVQSAGNLLASSMAGLLWTLVSPSAAFTYLVAWMAAASIALVLARPART